MNTAGGGDRPGWLEFSDGGEVELSDGAVDCVEAIANAARGLRQVGRGLTRSERFERLRVSCRASAR